MKNWKYNPSVWIGTSLKEKLKSFPREKDMGFSIVRIVWNLFLRLFLKLYFRISFLGKENLPKNQNFILVANHSSHLDTICLMAGLPLKKINKIYSAAAKDYFFSTFFRSLFSTIFVNAVPFDRKKKQQESLNQCIKLIEDKEKILILFPEGTRSISGAIQEFKVGIGHLLAGKDILVIPAFIKGAHRAWSKRMWFPFPFKIEVFFGDPKVFSELLPNKENYQLIAKELEKSVKNLGNLYV